MGQDQLPPDNSRRHFFKWAAGAAASITAMGVDLHNGMLSQAFAQAGVDAGAGDFGIFNVVYIMEQIESTFYTTVLAHPYRGMSAYEEQILTGIRNNEVTHRELVRTTLGAAALPELPIRLDRVNFANRQSVLTTAKMFEDLGTSAFNGAGPYLQSPFNLALAGQLVSVEARQAALLRDMLAPYSRAFAGDDVVNRQGLEVARVPSQIIPKQQMFVGTAISASQLP